MNPNQSATVRELMLAHDAIDAASIADWLMLRLLGVTWDELAAHHSESLET